MHVCAVDRTSIEMERWQMTFETSNPRQCVFVWVWTQLVLSVTSFCCVFFASFKSITKSIFFSNWEREKKKRMGKKYYCDYCEKSFKDDPNIRKKHIEGLPHQKARIEHYANFKSNISDQRPMNENWVFFSNVSCFLFFLGYLFLGAQEILKSEDGKKPCAKFPSGACRFGATCRFSHYTGVQLAKLRQQGTQKVFSVILLYPFTY